MLRPFHLLLVFLMLLGLAGCAIPGMEPPKVTVQIVYGSEKQDWMTATTEAFNAQELQTEDGKTIVIEAIPMGSNDSLQRILAGELQPTVWSPASSILLPVANAEWTGATPLVDAAPPALVLSPVVIAMWEPMAQALGWPEKQLGWADIAEMASSGATWADYGHAEWGPFQFGHTHPAYSNSGITSVLATTYAATGKTRDLTVADVQQESTGEFLQAVESSIIHYGESTGFFADQMFNRGPAYLSAAVLYENLVVSSYDRQLYPNTVMPVVAIYPKEGTFWSDHPYAILDAPWVSAEQRAAAERFRDFLLDRPQQELALQYGFRPADADLAIGAPIDAAHGADPGQPQNVLAVPEAEVITAVQDAWSASKKRVDVMVVLDVSGSMAEEARLANAKTALRNFISRLNDADGFGLTVFSNEARVVSEVSPIGEKRMELLNAIDGLFPQGNTRLIQTTYEAYEALSQEPAGERIRAMVVLSDGADNRSDNATLNELLNTLNSEGEGYSIKVFTIAYGSGGDVNQDLLTQISNASGARMYKSSPTEINEVYDAIATFF
jgi:Ca-activated chloride channel family protein